MAEGTGEAQHLWLLKVGALFLSPPVSQPSAEHWSHKCYLPNGWPPDASTPPICPGTGLCRFEWNIRFVSDRYSEKYFGFRTCHRQFWQRGSQSVWNQNFEIYCKGHFLQGIPRYFFFFFKGRKSFDKVTTPGCLSLNQRSSSEDFWVDRGYRFQSQFYLFRLMCGSPWCPHKLKAARMESWGH